MNYIGEDPKEKGGTPPLMQIAEHIKWERAPKSDAAE